MVMKLPLSLYEMRLQLRLSFQIHFISGNEINFQTAAGNLFEPFTIWPVFCCLFEFAFFNEMPLHNPWIDCCLFVDLKPELKASSQLNIITVSLT